MAKLKNKSTQKGFVRLNVWPHTKTKLSRQARNRKETLAKYLDLLSDINK